ncbi:L-carnitine dehydratase/bile acid-inducible protein F [Phenylobacterium zucineum HLK1]|uniref:L-carnitine dehydratase/bile acid-inducible protein F n=1 Tax=Phenylobacterium zucineum (strain HLK1) TaxID=450851 RepID=B4R9H5_PHEZH|nr:CoA transferase [Phenylobacterium zucineum]ACG79435.1 L-carnitine dehydratase/bile acid-inducible protein F [Phenylobacterium zucineum HLK1]
MYDLLKGLRVVEGAAFVAAPTCGLYLAQMGAEVIRFDNIGGGPDFRRWPLADNGASLYWEGLNKAKKSVAIDLTRPEGREIAQRLAAAPGEDGGLFVTNFPVDGFLSYETLRKLRQDLICVRVMGWADGSQGMDYTINSAIGLPQMTGPVDDPRPVNHVLAAWDLLTGAYCAFALVSALLARHRTGEGREIRAPLSDIAAATMANLGFTAETLLAGHQRPRMGNDVYGAFGRDFLTRDGQTLMLLAITPKQWSKALEVLGLKEAVAALEAELGVSFAADEGLRFAHRARLYPLFERAFAARDLAELAPAFDAGGVTWGSYQPLEAALEDPRLFKGNPLFEAVRHPSGLTYPAPGAAATIPQDARGPVRPAPRLGEHTDEVLADVLGLGSGEIGRLHDAGVVAGPA